MEEKTAKAWYTRMSETRDQYLDRARDAAKVTVPSLVPPEGFNYTQKVPTPWQGLGERGVRNLASKLLLILLPPNTPSYKLALNLDAVDPELQASKGVVDEAFTAVERAIVSDIESSDVRVKAFECLKQLVVAGNALLYLQDNASFKVYKLPQYVVQRSPDGTLERMVLVERVSTFGLPDDIKAIGNIDDNTDHVDVYTLVERDDEAGVFRQHQEINDKIIPDTVGTDPIDVPRWLPLRMDAIDGEHYGRGYVEGLLGDLTTYDALSRHITEGAAAMAKLILLVKPNATTKPSSLMKENLSVEKGNPDDVGVVQIDKSADFGVALQLSNSIRERLEFSFLLNTAIQRNAERVTAEEIRFMAGELEDALGGVYSVLAQEFQRPYIMFQLKRLERDGRLPTGLPDFVDLQIATGLQALGRGRELQRLQGAYTDMVALFGQEMAARMLNADEATKRIFAARQVETQGLIRSMEEVQAEIQQERMQAMAAEAAKSAAGPVSAELARQYGEQPTQGE